MSNSQVGKFVWFELNTKDVSKARGFYGELLGWKIESMPMGAGAYEMASNGGKPVAGIVALEDASTPSYWVSYLGVEDVDAAAKKVTQEGGKILREPSDYPNVGRMSEVTDPQGARFYLFKSSTGESTDSTPKAGNFFWNELSAKDGKAAAEFYKKIVGYEIEAMDMGEMGTYYVLKMGGVALAGAMTAPMPDMPTAWLPYINVEGVDGVAQRAARLGGTVLHQPHDIPGVGRFALLADPVGAMIAVITPVPM